MPLVEGLCGEFAPECECNRFRLLTFEFRIAGLEDEAVLLEDSMARCCFERVGASSSVELPAAGITCVRAGTMAKPDTHTK